MNHKRLKTVESDGHGVPITDRQSVNRLNDTLVKVIFFYLPLKTKLDLISLNQRLKRCLSESQKDLIVDPKLGNDFNCLYQLISPTTELEEDEGAEEVFEDEYEGHLKINVNKHVFKGLLKTFKEVEAINLINIHLDIDLVQVICDNFFPQLKTLKFTNFKSSADSMKKLGQTYGQRLTKIIIQSPLESNESNELDRVLLGFCPNLKKIFCENIESLVTSGAKDNYLPHLESISTSIKTKTHFECLEAIEEKYRNQLKELSLFIQTDQTEDLCLHSISKLPNLECLHLDFFESLKNLNQLAESLERIADNCKRITSLRIDCNYYSKALISDDSLKAFGHFSHLKRFWAQLLAIEADEDDPSDQKKTKQVLRFDINFLKGCTKLTDLDLCLTQMKEDFFSNIETLLPNLLSVKISSGEELSDLTLRSLSRLPKLKSLVVSKSHFKKESFPMITDSAVESFFTTNASVRSLVFMGQPNITQKSVDFLTDFATKNPNKNYRFECLFRYYDESEDQTLSERVVIDHGHIPDNLWINICSIDCEDDDSDLLYEETDNEDESGCDDEEDEDVDQNQVNKVRHQI